MPRLKRANTAGPSVLLRGLGIESGGEGDDSGESDSSSESSGAPDSEDSEGSATPSGDGSKLSLTPAKRESVGKEMHSQHSAGGAPFTEVIAVGGAAQLSASS